MSDQERDEVNKLRLAVAGLVGAISSMGIIRDAGMVPAKEVIDYVIKQAEDVRRMMGLPC